MPDTHNAPLLLEAFERGTAAWHRALSADPTIRGLHGAINRGALEKAQRAAVYAAAAPLLDEIEHQRAEIATLRAADAAQREE